MKHLWIKHVDWDTEGYTLEECLLPSQLLLFNAPNDWDDAAYRQRVADELTDVFGFMLYGFEAEEYRPPEPGEPGTRINVEAVMVAPPANWVVRRYVKMYRDIDRRHRVGGFFKVQSPTTIKDDKPFRGLLLPPNNDEFRKGEQYYCFLGSYCRITIASKADAKGRVAYVGQRVRPAMHRDYTNE